MASQHYPKTLLFLLLMYIFLFLSPPSYSYAQAPDSHKLVDLTLYYETLCPYCSYFIAHDLVRVFRDGLNSIVNLRLVPWGNAGIDSSGSFQCQHGTGECLLNTVEACAIDAYPDPNNHYFFIQCIETLAYQKREAEWQSCFDKASLDSQPIFDCYNQGNGRRLETQYAYETGQLNPPHSYVPWVLVNNQPLREDYRNFVSHVCQAYKGASVPAICSSAQFEINSLVNETADAAEQACSVRENKNLTSFAPTEILHQSKRVFTERSKKH